jgi:hypothetical protein
MQLFGFLVAAMVAFMVAFAFDFGGTVSFLIFLLIVLIGATVRVFQPIIAWARGPASKL